MSATLTLRVPTGAPLTNQQVDNNFTALNTWGNTINSNVGVLSNLTTSSTSNVVDAINTIKSGNLSIFASTTSVQLANIISDETGSGNLVFATSPSLTTPNIGTPGYASLTNATGLPVATGISGLAANVAIFLASPTSATFASALADENGTGYIVYNISPLLITPNIGTPSYAELTNASGTAASLAVGKITITNETAANVTYYPILSVGTSGNNSANVSSSKLTFNPSTGLLTSTDYNSSSDITLKENFTQIKNPLDILTQLTGFGFSWKESGDKSYGLSAQEVEKIIPEIVRTRPDGYKGINYMNLIAFLVEAIKDLKQEVQELKKYK